MSNFGITIIASFILMGIAILCLAIGWLMTGKVKIRRGSCGYNPKDHDSKKKSGCGGKEFSCQFCDPEENESKKEQQNDSNT